MIPAAVTALAALLLAAGDPASGSFGVIRDPDAPRGPPAAGKAPVEPTKAAQGKYLYDVSDTSGPVPSNWASLAYDQKHKELYVVDREDGSIGIFSESGMEVYRFGQDSVLGSVLSVTVNDAGELIVLGVDKGNIAITRCNFRGEPRGRIELSNVPPELSKDFIPDTVIHRGGKLYFAQKGALKVLVTDLEGRFESGHDFFRELGMDKMKAGRAGIPAMQGFNVDEEGNILFTIGPLFRAFVVAPSGKVSAFGERGGSPGRFNIVGGITRDERGYIIVTDLLRCVVMVFTPEFDFRGEFGGRGWGPGELIAPLDVAAGDGKIFVSQSAGRGVTVFQFTVMDVPKTPPVQAQN